MGILCKHILHILIAYLVVISIFLIGLVVPILGWILSLVLGFLLVYVMHWLCLLYIIVGTVNEWKVRNLYGDKHNPKGQLFDSNYVSDSKDNDGGVYFSYGHLDISVGDSGFNFF
jgi:hypothetical protein